MSATSALAPEPQGEVPGAPAERRLAGRVALVTGAGRGIGRAIAESFASAGARVAICARTASELEQSAASLRARGGAAGDVFARQCDITSAAQVAAFAAAVTAEFGAPSILVNNAGTVARGRLDEQSEHDWLSVIDVNLVGAFRMTRALLPAMRRAGSGRIINIGSISGRQGTPELTAYCAAKHAIVGLTRALAEELRDEHIQVNAICPGSVDTGMLEGSGFPPAMSAGDIARVALFLAADAPDALTGACLDVFG